MFLRVMKHKIMQFLAYTALVTSCLYNGISCLATLYMADKQPYLLSGTERLNFMGYHMMATMHGVICIALTVVFILLVRWKRKNKTKV